jgi:glycosyltransferase involved in cell wall biosynthesis
VKKAEPSKPAILFLYSELADYFIACLKCLSQSYEVDIHVIHWAVNKEAPFAFHFPQGIHFYEKSQFSFSELKNKVKEISPDCIYCSGWIDKDYLKIAKGFRKKIPVIIGIDSQWQGTFKQYLACIISRFTIKTIFSHCWVPGNRQKRYALNLGFENNRIMLGAYSSDVDKFMALGEKFLPGKIKKYPHILIYAGRYNRVKGIKDLWEAFTDWQNEQPNDWELWCLGTGTETYPEHPKIKHFGFIQPENMDYFIENGGIFILPSLFEPWGLVLHEFAAAGFPLICSDAVGASEAFLTNNENGFIFKAGNKDALNDCISKLTSYNSSALIEMGNKSRQKAMQITPHL